MCGGSPLLPLLRSVCLSVRLPSLLVVSFLYVVGGCVFKRQKQGTQGMESCPNIDFWRGLPGLVKDGCAFFLLQCKNMVARCQGKPTASSAESDYSTFK